MISKGMLAAIISAFLLVTPASAFEFSKTNNPTTRVAKYVLPYTAVVTADVTHDTTIFTLPAGAVVRTALARVTTAFVCAAVCTTATLSATLGITAGGTELLASFDIDAAAATFGDTNAEVGSGLTAAGATNGGYIPAFTATQALVLRLTSGTGNFGAAGVTNLNAGSLTVWVVYEVLS